MSSTTYLPPNDPRMTTTCEHCGRSFFKPAGYGGGGKWGLHRFCSSACWRAPREKPSKKTATRARKTPSDKTRRPGALQEPTVKPAKREVFHVKRDRVCQLCEQNFAAPRRKYCDACGAIYKRLYRELADRRRPNPAARLRENTRSYSNVLLRRGDIERQPCQICGAPGEMHHPDYSDPRRVEWYCREHHRALHRKETDAT